MALSPAWEARMVEIPLCPERVLALRREAGAAGFSESEVEKISTCPLVRLLANQS